MNRIVKKLGQNLVRLVSITSIFLMLSSGYGYPFSARVIKVADGDTVTAVTEDGQPLKVRLFGIDAPEKNQAYGQKSKKALSGMINRKEVDIEIVAGDKYGRSVGIIYLGNKTINEEMVKKGHAWVYRRYCSKSECRKWIDLEEEAKRDKKGLWNDSDPLPPWEFRHAKKDSDKGFWDLVERLLK
ncbi:thermonuclease family protein [Desulforegula conservatrix]|uniref:thermonuclease family protein n=1 Tax=Desulforegula conservatrix TaxID=153026 RepID=UPI0004068674|nr:thermonuclease family protein [Desulforegula conservatrix]